MTGIRVLPQDLPPAGLCVSGARRWFHTNGLDFRQFMTEGTPIEVMRAVGCPLGERACVSAEERTAREADNGR